MTYPLDPADICPDCDGFPEVAIDTGWRLPDGTRLTLKVTCPGCGGTGRAWRVPVAVEVSA